MSNKPISVGDLVVVVRATCCPNKLRMSATVTDIIRSWTGLWECGVCHKAYLVGTIVRIPELATEKNNPCTGWWPLADLKRLDPGSLSEDTPTKEELSA